MISVVLLEITHGLTGNLPTDLAKYKYISGISNQRKRNNQQPLMHE
jgi:hypothetical protein